MAKNKYETNATLAKSKNRLTRIKGLYRLGNEKRFKACVELYYLKKGKVKHGELMRLYKQLGIHKDYGAKLIQVGRAFCDFKSDHVDAYSISHLIRLAKLNDLGKRIISWRAVYTVELLNFIASNLQKLSGIESQSILEAEISSILARNEQEEAEADFSDHVHQDKTSIEGSSNERGSDLKLGISHSVEPVPSSFQYLLGTIAAGTSSVQANLEHFNLCVDELKKLTDEDGLGKEARRIINKQIEEQCANLKSCEVFAKKIRKGLSGSMYEDLGLNGADEFIGTERN